MNYGNVYVAQISMGANRVQTQQAFMEAMAYDGPSLIIAYSPCIAHGINMMESAKIAKDAVECGWYGLYIDLIRVYQKGNDLVGMPMNLEVTFSISFRMSADLARFLSVHRTKQMLYWRRPVKSRSVTGAF